MAEWLGCTNRGRILLMIAFVLLALTITTQGEGATETSFDLLPDGMVVDQGGRRIAPQKTYRRIISLYGAHTENLFALGLDDAVIGVSPHESHPPAALTKPVFSYRDDPERFLAVHPDLVLIRPMIERAYAQLVRRLELSGVTVVSLQPTAVDQIPVYWRILGQLTGRQAAAAQMQVRFDTAVTAFRALGRQVDAPKRVYFEAMHRQMRTFAPTAMPIFALESAGGVNVAVDAQTRPNNNIALYGRERILAHAHEIDLYLAQVGVMNRVSREQIRNAPGFGVIRAVAEDQIHLIDEALVSRPTLRLLEGIYTIGLRLYPRHFEAAGVAILARAGLSLPEARDPEPQGGSH